MKVLIIIYSILVLFLVATVYIKYFAKLHITAKIICSLGYLFIATYCAYVSQDYFTYATMIPAFFFCFLGDTFLVINLPKYKDMLFMAGLSSFLIGHIGFLWALHFIQPLALHECVGPVLVVVVTYCLSGSKNMEVGKARIPVLGYSFFVSMLASKGISIVVYNGIGLRNILIGAGAVLFWISDFIILFIIFYKKKYKASKFLNLYTYYYGVLLLALSIAF